MAQIQNDQVRLIWPEDFEQIHFTDLDFKRDGAHMTTSGLEKVSQFIGQLLNDME